MGKPDQTEIRLLILDGLQKGARRSIQPMRYARQQALAAFQQGSHVNWLGGHALEVGLESGLEIRGHTWRQHLHLGKAEGLLHPWPHDHGSHRMHRATHDGRRFDLRARTAATGHQAIDRPALTRRGLHLQFQRPGTQRIGQPPERFGDQLRIPGVIVHRQPGQIDVHRQARQIVFEQFDRRAALECKARLQGQHRQDLDQQPHAVRVAPVPVVKPGAHRGLPAR